MELARRISHSLSDTINHTSKGQSMYVNRKKKATKWVHEGGEGKMLLMICIIIVEISESIVGIRNVQGYFLANAQTKNLHNLNISARFTYF